MTDSDDGMDNDASKHDESDDAVSSTPSAAEEERSSVLPPRQESPPPRKSRDTTVYARGRELLAIAGIVAAADFLLYRSTGHAGYAVLLVVALPLLWVARPQGARCDRTKLAAIVMTALVGCAALRSLWLGNPAVSLAGFLLVIGWSRAVCGSQPFVLDTLLHTMLASIYGLLALPAYRYLPGAPSTGGENGSGAAQLSGRSPALFLPFIVTAAFATLFVLANPDLSKIVQDALSSFSEHFGEWIQFLLPDVPEVIFWGFCGVMAVGCVRPILRESLLDPVYREEETRRHQTRPSAACVLFASFRNTLIAVTGLFAVYLLFEFATLWRRDFPDGFYYAGYAHAGAAWLTVALVAASALLSAMFRGSMLADPRLPRLRTLAWVWSAENFLLAIAVINRLLIYVDFNGMTRMRTVGFLGVAAVIGGFALVIAKIAQRRGFVWLLRGDLIVLALAILAYGLMPVDRMVHMYNTNQILAGQLAPSVQISEHPRDTGGAISLIPLLDCDDALIRSGVAAILANQAERIEARHDNPSSEYDIAWRSTKAKQRWLQWTTYQHAEHQFLQRYRAAVAKDDRPGEAQRARDFAAFKEYAYQWY